MVSERIKGTVIIIRIGSFYTNKLIATGAPNAVLRMNMIFVDLFP